MEQSENVFFRVINIFANFVLLNILWFVCCIPVITFFPATTAMYRVVHHWHKDGIDFGVTSLFFRSFKLYFKKSFIIGLGWLFVALILYLNGSILIRADFAGEMIVSLLFSFMCIVFVFISVYIFFIIERSQQSLLEIIKLAIILPISHLYSTLLCIILIVGFFLLSIYLPIFFILMGSMIAFIQYYIFDKMLKRLTSF
ncbi:DUF624 domain-containing protein [Gracilibacillus oryzae]|uniref:DUF624 domain-containing protein n=1 Tax=Gracilibacillus oryzae TaxID=1672701 RepID=A0A7C8GQQ0_9BACI|nr:DUF624 domain-containing protein [Gracilibacillus oryzae]KAB8125860.1 DUF624 domain-containing protein [Gracilibacillus oryzae]